MDPSNPSILVPSVPFVASPSHLDRKKLPASVSCVWPVVVSWSEALVEMAGFEDAYVCSPDVDTTTAAMIDGAARLFEVNAVRCVKVNYKALKTIFKSHPSEHT